ncbi:unnamed protein product, partial [Durusdinium trenchii]
MPLAEAGMATGFDDLDLPMLDKHLFTMLNLDVTLPAVGAHRSFGFKLRPSEHQHVFDVLEKFLQNLFQELDLVTSGGPDLQRDYLGVRDRAAASMDEWQGLVDDWKGSLLTRLGDLGNELTEVKKSETRLRQLLEQKEAELSEIREESRSLKKDLMRVRRRCSEERLEKLGLNDQGGSTPSTPSTSVIGFFAKTLGKGMSKEGSFDLVNREGLLWLLLSSSFVSRCGVDWYKNNMKMDSRPSIAVRAMRSMASREIQGILPGEVGDTLDTMSEDDNLPPSPRRVRDLADAG